MKKVIIKVRIPDGSSFSSAPKIMTDDELVAFKHTLTSPELASLHFQTTQGTLRIFPKRVIQSSVIELVVIDAG